MIDSEALEEFWAPIEQSIGELAVQRGYSPDRSTEISRIVRRVIVESYSSPVEMTSTVNLDADDLRAQVEAFTQTAINDAIGQCIMSFIQAIPDLCYPVD